MKPTLSELEKFEDQPEGIDLEVVTESGQCGYDDFVTAQFEPSVTQNVCHLQEFLT